jgi:hypothetical protein
MSTPPTQVLNLGTDGVPVWQMQTAVYDHYNVECDHCGQTVDAGEPAIYTEPPTDRDPYANYSEPRVYHIRCAMALASQLSDAVEAFMEQFLTAAQITADGRMVAQVVSERAE